VSPKLSAAANDSFKNFPLYCKTRRAGLGRGRSSNVSHHGLRQAHKVIDRNNPFPVWVSGSKVHEAGLFKRGSFG